MYYTVCEVAKRLKLSLTQFVFMARKVYWILLSETRTAIVFFKESDFERLFIIASLKRAGMSIKQIREFTVLCDKGDSTIAQRLKIITEQKTSVEEQITELQDALDVLKYKTWLYEVALEAGTTAVHDNLPLEKMPPHIKKSKNAFDGSPTIWNDDIKKPPKSKTELVLIK